MEEVKKDPKTSFLEPAFVKREPITLKQAPVSLSKSGKAIPAVRKPDAGKSYNPTVSDWVALIEREGDKEVEAEKKRLKEAEEEAARMDRAIKAAEEMEKEEDGNESAWESEWEGFSDEEGKLKIKRPERKTLAQRNKIKRRKDAERKAVHDAKIKAKEQQLQEVKRLAKSIKEKEEKKAAALAAVKETSGNSSDEEEEEELRRKRFGRHP
jgi:nucleolar protein 53